MEFLVILGGCLFAAYAGNYIAEENYVPIAAVLGGLLIVSVVFGLGSSIYVLIPICWGLTGQISLLPLPFDVRQLTVILTSIVFISGWIFKSHRGKVKIEVIDLWIWVNITYIFITFFRNPVGFASIGGGARVGGKPYVDVALGLMAYLMLSRFKISAKFIHLLPIIALCVSLFNCIAGAVQLFLPNVSFVLGRFYSAFAIFGASGVENIEVGETRLEFLQEFGVTLILYIVSQISPIKLISANNIGKLVAYISAFLMIFLSGFRNAIIASMINSFVSVYTRERFSGLLKMGFVAFSITVMGILISYTPFQIPLTFQRALCFLPGNWNEVAVTDARNSTEWRQEMWQMALTSNKYINSKIFGDGFGFRREDYDRAIDISMGNSSLGPNEAQQEIFLLDGDYHSGPVGTIRFVGVVGLLLLLPLMGYMAFMAWRLIKETLGTQFELCTLFYCIPAVVMPFFFFVIIGDYRRDIVAILFNVGMIKMLRNSITYNIANN